MMEMYFDGGCLPKNPDGVATYGFVIYDEQKKVLKTGYGIEGDGPGMTNNIAEYSALLHGLEYITTQLPDCKKLTIYGDSELVVKMVTKQWGFVNGVYNPHNGKPHLKVYLDQIQKLLEHFHIYNINWIPRKKNSMADSLTRVAYKEYQSGGIKKDAVSVPSTTFVTKLENFVQNELGVKDVKHKKELDYEMKSYDRLDFRYRKQLYTIIVRERGRKEH